MNVLPMSYSTSTLYRRFEVLDGLEYSDKRLWLIFDESIFFSAVVESVPVIHRNMPRHRILATLDCTCDLVGGLTIERFWQDESLPDGADFILCLTKALSDKKNLWFRSAGVA